MIYKSIEFVVATLVAFSAGVLCYSPLVALWNSETLINEGKMIALIIIILLALGLLFILVQSIQLLLSYRDITIAPRNNPQIWEIKEKLGQASIFGRRLIQPIYEEHNKFERIDFKNLLAIEFNRVANQRTYVKYGVGIMITLGILGTFLGLIDAVNASTNLLDSVGELESGREMAQKFKAPFSGMNTAFNTSILGIIGSVTLGFYNSVANRLQHSLFIELEKYFELYLMPAFYPKAKSVNALILDEIGTVSKETVKLYKKIGDDIEDFLTETRKEQQLIYSYTSEMRKEVHVIQNNFQEELKKAIHAFEGHLLLSYKDFRKESKQQHEAYLMEVELLAKKLKVNAEEIAKHIAVYSKGNSTHLSNISTDLESKLTNLQQRFSDTVNELRKEHIKNVEKLHKGFHSDLEETTKAIGKTLENRTLTLEGLLSDSIKANEVKFKQLYDHFEVHADKLAGVFQEKTQIYIDGVAKQSKKISAELLEGVGAKNKQFNEIQNHIIDQLNNSVKAFKQENEIMIDTYQETTNEYIAKTKAFQGSYEKFIKLISESNGILENTNGAFKLFSDNYSTHSDKVAGYHQQMLQLGQEYDENTKAVKAETAKLIESYREMASFFEALRSEEVKIAATFNALFDVVSSNLNNTSYESNGSK